jgi:hypothetical protein
VKAEERDDEMDVKAFSIRRVATTGHEIIDPDGNVVAWAADKPWALVIAGLLNRVEREGQEKKRLSRRPPTDKEDLPNTVRGQTGWQTNAVAACDSSKTRLDISVRRKEGTMNIRTLRVVDLDELLEDCPEVLEVMNSIDLPWTSGDCRYSLISGSDLREFLEEEEKAAEEEQKVADQSDHVLEQFALAIERVANFPEDVLIDL